MRLSLEREKLVIILRHSSMINPRQNGMNLDLEPCPTVMTGGLSAFGDYWIEDDGKPPMKTQTEKPPYRVPSMDEIRVIPWNGFKVASTFSGAGGSCLGYRMAGFQVVWANEFIPIAQESYRANADENCILDGRDIRQVKAAEILEAVGLKKGELDLFDGSPPCQAFSTAGKREKGWGKEKSYENGAKQCNEQLFDEYIRLLRGLMPKVFVAENVSGLVKGKAKGFFLEILKELKASGYRVTCRVLDAQWLGVPQTRQRTIFVGVRDDLGADPVHPKPLPYRYSVRDALPWIVSANQNLFGGQDQRVTTDTPLPTVNSVGGFGMARGDNRQSWVEVQSGAYPKKFTTAENPSPAGDDGRTTAMKNGTERRKFTIDELKRICAFPDDFILKGSYAQQWERLGNSVPPVMMFHIAREIEKLLREIKC